jgi:ABC-type transporter Mla MlaB component
MLHTSPQLRDDLLVVLRQQGPRLELDLRDVTFLDCAGVNVLLATRRRASVKDSPSPAPGFTGVRARPMRLRESSRAVW